MARQNPKYRGIYTYNEDYKPDGVTVKRNPKYRGIYAYNEDYKPSGVATSQEAPSEQEE